MKTRSFTLVEMLISLIVLSVLIALSVGIGQGAKSRSDVRICAQNQLVIFTMTRSLIEEGKVALPATAELIEKYGTKALAKIMRKDPFFMLKRKLYFALLRFGEPREAMAQTLANYTTGLNNFLTCPADHNYNNRSYAIHAFLLRPADFSYATPMAALAAVAAAGSFVVCDSENVELQNLANDCSERHSVFFGPSYAIGVDATGNARIVDGGAISSLPVTATISLPATIPN